MFFPASLVSNDGLIVASLAIGSVVHGPALSDVALVMYDVHSSDVDVYHTLGVYSSDMYASDVCSSDA